MTDHPVDEHDSAGHVAAVRDTPEGHPIGSALVRLRARADGAVVGAGFLLTETELVTCAHVVAEATGTDPEAAEPPGGLVTVDLPFLGSARLDAQVIAWRPVGAELPEDIAILRLREQAPGPARPARLLAPARLAGRPFEVCGFPEGNDAGAWAEGRTGQWRTDSTLQVGDPNQTGYAIQPGFSGAPVWDVLARGVIGMVVARERQGETKVAFILPVDRLRAVWPLPVTETHDPFAHLTAGVHDSLSGLRQLLAEYVGLPGMPHAFGGRGRSLDALDRWLDGPVCYALLVAEAGRGKTALLARWASAIAALGAADVVFVPVSVRFGTASHAPAMRLVLERLRHVLRVPGDFVADPTTWHSEAERLMEETPADASRRLLVIFDGVDEAAGWAFDRGLRFPVPSPAGLKVIVSARRTVDRDAEEWVDRLHWRGLAEVFDLEPLDRRGVAEVIASVGVNSVDLSTLADALWRLTGGDPLELQLYARQLQARSGDGVVDVSDLSARAPGLDGFFELWWEDQLALWSGQGRDDLTESEDINRLLGFAAIAQGALDYEDFAALGGGRLRQGAYLRRKLSELGRFLIPASHRAGEGGLVLAHPRLNLFFASEPRMLEGERGDLERQVYQYCRAMLQRTRSGDASRRVSAYAVRHLGVYAESAYGDSQTLYELVERAWHEAWQAFEGGVEGFLGDVDRARRRAEAESDAAEDAAQRRSPVGMQIRCALVLSSLTTQAESLDAGLIAALLRARMWTPQIAMEYALRPRSDQLRVERLAVLLGLLPSRQREEALTAITGSQWPVARSALINLSGSLTDQELRELLAVSSGHEDAVLDSVVLAEQARRTTGARQRDLASAAVGRILDTADGRRGWALAGLAPLLTPERLSDLSSSHPDLYAKALTATEDASELIAAVPPRMIPVLLDIAARDHGPTAFRASMGRLLARLPAGQRQRLIDSTVAGMWPGDRSAIFNGLAAAAAEEEFEQAVAQAVNEALAADHGKYSIYFRSFLQVVGSRLPAVLARRAFDAVEGLDVTYPEVWLALARAAPSRMTSDHWQSALSGALSISRELGRPLVTELLELAPGADPQPMLEAELTKLEATPHGGHSLGLLAEFLSPEQRERALRAARSVEPASQRAWALVSLERSAHGEEQRELLRDALAAATTVDDAQRIVATLASLAGGLDQGTRERVLDYALRPVNRQWALSTPALARLLSPEQAQQFLQSILRGNGHAASAYVDMQETEALTARLSIDALRDLLADAERSARPDMTLSILAAMARKGNHAALREARPLLSELSGNSAYPDLFWGFYQQLPSAQRVEFLDMALDYVRDIERHLSAMPPRMPTTDPDEERAEILVQLARDAPAAAQLAILAATETVTDSGPRAEALMLMSDALTGEAMADALDRALALPEESRQAQVLSGLGPRLRGPALARARQAVREFKDELPRLMGAVALLGHVAPALRAKTARYIIETAATFAPPSGTSFAMRGSGRLGVLPLDDVLIYRIIVAVLPALSPDERPGTLAMARRWIEPLPDYWHPLILNETVRHLCQQDLHEDALFLARQIPDVDYDEFHSFSSAGRPQALATVALSAAWPDLAAEAFEANLARPYGRRGPGFREEDGLVTTLTQLAPKLLGLAPGRLGSLLQLVLRQAAQSGRPRLLPVLGALAPVFAGLAGPESMSDLVNEILDIAEWLP